MPNDHTSSQVAMTSLLVNYLPLLFVPVAFYLELSHQAPELVFVSSALALLPLAVWMGRATEALAARSGSVVGGLLNATFGNLTELIIGIVALSAGKTALVKASITGSILCNLLLVLGTSILAGGISRPRQFFNKQAASLSVSLLTLALIALLLPATFDLAEQNYFQVDSSLPDQAFGLMTALVLITVYLANIFFSLITHRDLLSEGEKAQTVTWSVAHALGVLSAATVGVALLSEFLVRSLEPTTTRLGLSEFFVGIILIPIIGNAAEHATAITFALRNKMALSVQIAIGSTLQIALLVAPLLVLIGAVLGHPMNLVFENPLELASLFFAVIATNAVVRDGETHWLEGVLLLAVYSLLALAAFFTPS